MCKKQVQECCSWCSCFTFFLKYKNRAILTFLGFSSTFLVTGGLDCTVVAFYINPLCQLVRNVEFAPRTRVTTFNKHKLLKSQ